MPFDRLIRTVDRWATEQGRSDVFAQIGTSEYRPKAMRWTRFLEPEEFKRHYEAAKVIVAHAGTGSILTALQLGKPILVMPRRAALLETRNDHQVATAQEFSRLGKISVASDETELLAKLAGLERLKRGAFVGPHASASLIDAIQKFIDGPDGATSLR